MEPPNSTNASSESPGERPVWQEAPAGFGLMLPVDPGFRSLPPSGSWEDGYRLSLAALELVKDRPEVFLARSQRMVDVEFVI